MLDGLKRMSTALGLLAATAAVTQAQTPAQSYNQATAEAVAGALRSSPNLSPYRIEIETQSGMATLSGTLTTLAQKAEAIALAQRVPGITAVVDRLDVATDSRVRPVQYQMAGGQPGGFHGGPGSLTFRAQRSSQRAAAGQLNLSGQRVGGAHAAQFDQPALARGSLRHGLGAGRVRRFNSRYPENPSPRSNDGDGFFFGS